MQNNQKGVSLIITFFIMIIILAVVLSVSSLLYGQLKIIRNIGGSVMSLYAADSGIEKVLFYDTNILPTNSDDTILAKRGLCTMYSVPSGWTSLNICAVAPADTVVANPEIYCSPKLGFETPKVFTAPSDASHDNNGCDPDKCDDCQISFSTAFGNEASYTVLARVYTSIDKVFPDTKIYNYEIESKGSYRGASRQLKISMNPKQSGGVIQIDNACAAPKTNEQGATITIVADVKSVAGNSTYISTVQAYVYDAQGVNYDVDGNSTGLTRTAIDLSLHSGDNKNGTWQLDWHTNSIKTYYVDITATDSTESGNPTTKYQIPPCGFGD